MGGFVTHLNISYAIPLLLCRAAFVPLRRRRHRRKLPTRTTNPQPCTTTIIN